MPRSRRWTLRSSVSASILSVLASGCHLVPSAPSPTPVTVNLDRVLRVSLGEKPTPPRPPKLDDAKPLKDVELPAEPSSMIITAPQDAEELRRLLRQQQEVDRERLERQLRKLYAREAKRFEVELKRQFAELDESSFSNLASQVRAIFESYAAERMPKVARLAFLVGWPDPNKANTPPNPSLPPVPKQRLQEAELLRTQLGQLDQGFRSKVDQLALDRFADLAVKRAELLVEIEKKKDEMNRLAQQEAERQVADAAGDFRLELARGAKIPLAAEPSYRLSFPTPASPKADLKVPSPLSDGDPAWLRPVIESDLRVWLGLRHYRIAPTGRDVTDEFLAWRNSQNP